MNEQLKFFFGALLAGSGATVATLLIMQKFRAEHPADHLSQEIENLNQEIEALKKKDIGNQTSSQYAVGLIKNNADELRRLDKRINALASDTWHVRAKFYEVGLKEPRYRIDVWEKAEGIDQSRIESITNIVPPGETNSSLPQRKFTEEEAARILEYYDLDEFLPEVQRQLEEVQ